MPVYSARFHIKGMPIVCKKSRLFGEGGSVLKIGFFYMAVRRSILVLSAQFSAIFVHSSSFLEEPSFVFLLSQVFLLFVIARQLHICLPYSVF